MTQDYKEHLICDSCAEPHVHKAELAALLRNLGPVPRPESEENKCVCINKTFTEKCPYHGPFPKPEEHDYKYCEWEIGADIPHNLWSDCKCKCHKREHDKDPRTCPGMCNDGVLPGFGRSRKCTCSCHASRKEGGAKEAWKAAELLAPSPKQEGGVDLGPWTTCGTCRLRLCVCPNREQDGSIRSGKQEIIERLRDLQALNSDVNLTKEIARIIYKVSALKD